MLSQQIAVPILLPMAVTVLTDNPLAEGDYYPGDLLHAVLQLPEQVWHGKARERHQLVEVLRATPLPNQDITDLCHAIGVFVAAR